MYAQRLYAVLRLVIKVVYLYSVNNLEIPLKCSHTLNRSPLGNPVGLSVVCSHTLNRSPLGNPVGLSVVCSHTLNRSPLGNPVGLSVVCSHTLNRFFGLYPKQKKGGQADRPTILLFIFFSCYNPSDCCFANIKTVCNEFHRVTISK